ncbi:VWA domain-containing protein [Phycisphaerales bacterium AB-hyl4]|uniref:VWA domain-containing protein n=1 Tax=Natronomicrosphaera hydrolytica TaxID=3242702 RepID=A0ABV4U097_9BACT
MKFEYSEFDGQPFQGPDALFPEPKLVQFILQYGEQALDAMEQVENEDGEDYIESLIEAGLIEKSEDEDGKGKYQLTPKMVKGIQHKALLEIFENIKRGTKEGHETRNPGRTSERTDGTKTYEFGDPLSEVDFGATMRNAMARQLADKARHGEATGPSLPININAGDFDLHVTEGTADCATVILIDQSGSMMRWGRFYQAKRVALGMAGLIQQRFPQDTLDFVGFYSMADAIRERDLPLVMPKPISVRDYQVRLRLPLDQARENEDQIPLHFTNLQLGLRQARQILSRRGAMNKQIFVITDGQPTAHVEPNEATPGSEMLYLLYPPNERTATATLKEALKCQQQGIRIATFALIEDYWGMDWVGFVDRLTRLTRGMAYYCTSDDLSSTVIESYFAGKKKKSFIH